MTSHSVPTVTANAKVIVALSESGKTGHMIARHRPFAPILVLTPYQTTYNQTLIVFGCEPVLIKPVKGLITARKAARQVITDRKLAKKGDCFILGAGIPFGPNSTTNTMMIEEL